VNSKYEIKLIDFGSASQIPTKRDFFFTRYNGTPHFASPEIANGSPYQGPQAEVWTLGVLLYTIIFGENPFQDKSDILAYNGKLNYPRLIEIDLQRLLESMLCINVKNRITLDKVFISDNSYFRLKRILGAAFKFLSFKDSIQ
jgi:serine/threonine protein kinase